MKKQCHRNYQNLALEQAEEIYNKHVETAKQLAAERAMFD